MGALVSDYTLIADDRAKFLRKFAVSRETLERLDSYGEMLNRWSRVKNLVADSTLTHLWTRHFQDSYQLIALAGNASRWCDLGSGAGFPGLVIAIALADTAGGEVHLVESNQRKCAFLQEVIRNLRLPAVVHNARAEDVCQTLEHVDVVTARAFAPLARLLDLASPLLIKGARGVFLKGLHIDDELTEAAKYWHIDWELRPSVTDPSGQILIVNSVC